MKRLLVYLTPILVSLLLAACGGSDNHHHSSSSSNQNNSSTSSSAESSIVESSMSSTSESSASSVAMVSLKYSITIQNITAGQPLSPTAYVLHQPGYHAFIVGTPASMGVEHIAEAGNPTDFLAEANAMNTTLTSGRADAVLMPGNQVVLEASTTATDAMAATLEISVLSMLGNTNDGFSAIDAAPIGQLAIGDSATFSTLSFDAGTEANSETLDTVPGPVAGGEGFNSARDDIADKVSLHPGAMTALDNPNSALTSMQRWDNPVARITITRMSPE